MGYYIDYSYKSLHKIGEELCGDNVEVVKKDNGIILVLADGLGSGVKANILATLTSKIAVTMLKEGLSVEETIDTITNTLPVCSIRKLAYSTFTIIQIKDDGDVYLVEYENPNVFVYRNNKKFDILRQKREINNKWINESFFKLRKGDVLVAVSDGVIHAGVGERLNLGWQWESVDSFLEDLVKVEIEAKDISKSLVEVCNALYNERAGDDTTVATITLREKSYLDLFTGPPKDKNKDKIMIEKLKKAKGTIIVSGGTTANIVARELKEDIEVDLKNYDRNLPPIAKIKGIDLVTEGLLTLNRVVDLLKNNESTKGNDGASKILDLLLNRTTNITIHLGKAVNEAHQNPDFPEEFNLKVKVVNELKELLEHRGKVVRVEEI